MSVFTPAIRIMDKFKYASKFTLVIVLILIPLISLSYILLADYSKQITFLQQEKNGLQYITQVRQLLAIIPQHRGMTNAYLNGNITLKGKILEVEQKVDQAFSKLQQVDNQLGGVLATGDKAEKLNQHWNELKDKALRVSAKESFKEHTQLIADTMDLIHRIADSSNLILDPELDSYYLMDLLVNRLPALTEAMGQARGLASGIAAAGMFTPENWSTLSIRVDRFQGAKTLTEESIEAGFKANSEIAKQLEQAQKQATASVTEFARLLQKDMLEPDTIHVSSDQVFNSGTQAISHVFSFYDAITPVLNGLFEQRIAANYATERTAIVIIVAVLTLIIYLFVGFFLSVRHSIRQLSEATEQLAQGDLTAQVALSTRDELSEVANGINRMASAFAKLVGRVTGSINQVATAAEELSTITTQTQQGVSSQQQEIEMVASSINEMGASVQEVARSAGRAAEAANDANREAQNGQGVVNSTRQAIGRLATDIGESASSIKQLEQDSRNIGSVLVVIKEIAEQTNLLALNAAIEAARAGEQGRGFAVVADEVRTLASRTQASTQEIEDMISHLQSSANAAVTTMESSRASTDETVNKASQTEESLNTIAKSISAINDMNAQIASASEQQTAVADEVNISISNINTVSEQTAAGARQTKASSEELAKLATELQELVRQFKL